MYNHDGKPIDAINAITGEDYLRMLVDINLSKKNRKTMEIFIK
jgi:hypothetical protein